MTIHRVVLAIESAVVLVPLTFIACLGGYWMLLLMLGQEIRSTPFQAIGVSACVLMCWFALLALWVLTIQALCRFQCLDDLVEKRFFIFAHIGAAMVLYALILSAIVAVFSAMGEWTIMSVRVFLFGLPALLPYAHIIYLKRATPAAYHREPQHSALPEVRQKFP